MLFPSQSPDGSVVTCLALSDAGVGDDLPNAVGVFAAADPAALGEAPDQGHHPRPLLVEHALDVFTRPGLRGQRLAVTADGIAAGRAWSPRFTVTEPAAVHDGTLRIAARDAEAGLELVTEAQSLPGGTLRIRHTVRNIGEGEYLLDGLEVHLPVGDDMDEILDFTGRHENERAPQRHDVVDGMWLREFRKGRPNFEGAVLVVGTKGFGFHHGSVLLVQTAWSGNSVLAVDRDTIETTGVVAGELLLPGEIVLKEGGSYTMPWVMVTASDEGLDGAMHSLHTWERTLPGHPACQPVTLNVWEGVMFDHDLDKLKEIARRAARIGVERYVLDDGWFHLRRDDHAGLGDWWVDTDVWPDGLHPLVDFVHGLGMQFGLWFEPEMVNADSDMFRAHPDWILQASGRTPIEHRNQQVVDLTNPEAFDHVLDAVSKVLGEYAIDYVKWDHNRFILEGGANRRGGAPAVHEQTLAYYRLLDALRERFPKVEWESCASGGGRIDVGVIEKVKRFWTSDMTDALSRQRIQRWTLQTIAPEYIGAHISQPSSQQSGRTFSLAFRAATAVFYSFGIEWDVTKADDADLDELAAWIEWYKANRDLLHSGRSVRLDVPDPAVFGHGVVAADRSRAIIAHVQYEESQTNRGVYLRVPGLDPEAEYTVEWTGPEPPSAALETLDGFGPLGATKVTGRYLATVGVRFPRCRPETIRLVDIVREQ